MEPTVMKDSNDSTGRDAQHRRTTGRCLLAAAVAVLMGIAAPQVCAAEQAEALFAGGCFWCEEATFEDRPGIISVTSGYTGGTVQHPSYEQVSAGGTGHAESVRVVYDPTKITYPQLLDLFWHNVDPLDSGGQFCDRGSQYRSAIFYETDEQKKEAFASKEALEKSGRFGKPIATEIVAAGAFYPAEDYHQDYYKKNPAHYHAYRLGCGRDRRLQQLWGNEAGSGTH